MMSQTPIAFFAYNRPEVASRTLRALAANSEFCSCPLYIFVDGPKADASESVRKKIDEMRILAQEVVHPNKTLLIRDTNQGLAGSLTAGISTLLESYDRVIVIEDDILLGRHALEFLLAGLDVYKNEPSVFSIGLSSYFFKRLRPGTTFLPVLDCWGWATWRRAWKKFEPDGIRLYEALRRENKLFEFNLWGATNYEGMLVDQIEGRVNSWAIRWQAVGTLNSGLCLYPTVPLAMNIGFGEDATHTKIGQPPFTVDQRRVEIDYQEPVIQTKFLDLCLRGVAFETEASHRRAPLRKRLSGIVKSMKGSSILKRFRSWLLRIC